MISNPVCARGFSLSFLTVTRMVNVYCGHGCLAKVFQGHLKTTTRAAMTERVSFSSPVLGEASLVVSDAHGLQQSTPWLMLPPDTDPTTGGKVDCFYNPTNNDVYKLNRKKILGIPEEAWCFTSSRGWLGFVDPADCSLYLSTPFRDSPTTRLTGSLVKLPSIETLPSVLGVKRKPSSSYFNHSVNQFMIVDPDNNDDSKGHHCRYTDPKSLSKFIVKHLSLSLDSFWGKKEDCIALAVQGELPQLAFCRVGVDETWTPLIGSTVSFPQTAFTRHKLKDNWNMHYAEDDIKLFYSMYTDMFGHGIDTWEICKPHIFPTRYDTFIYQEHSIHLHERFKFEPCERNLRNQCEAKRYLVAGKSSRNILLVIRHIARHVAEDGSIVDKDPSHDQQLQIKAGPNECHKLRRYKTLKFDVYNVDMEKKRLKRLKFIGNRVIFLGLNQSFVLSACKFPGLRPNSIYFTDDCTETTWGNAIPYAGQDMGIYNLEDNSIEPCYPFADDLKDKKTMQPLVWVAPNSSPYLWVESY